MALSVAQAAQGASKQAVPANNGKNVATPCKILRAEAGALARPMMVMAAASHDDMSCRLMMVLAEIAHRDDNKKSIAFSRAGHHQYRGARLAPISKAWQQMNIVERRSSAVFLVGMPTNAGWSGDTSSPYHSIEIMLCARFPYHRQLQRPSSRRRRRLIGRHH